MIDSMFIGTRRIGRDAEPFVIAEMSGNHNQSLDRALALVDAAASAGAHAIKLQTYTADTITMQGAHQIEDAGSPWNGVELHALYSRAHTPWPWHRDIFARARSRGLIAFSSPFDESAVDFLESLEVPAYKIASFENEHYPLIKRIVATGKPLIMSTGVIDQPALDESVAYLRSLGAKKFVLLKCTSTYPASPEHTNLRAIPAMERRYGCQVGLSDHTRGIGASVAAVALGATVIEKHFTLRREDGGVDSTFSLEPDEVAALVRETKTAWLALGDPAFAMSEKERVQTILKRSIYAAKDMAPGHMIQVGDIKVIRPAKGLHPREYEASLGRSLARGIRRGEPLTAEHLTS
jgi:N-acetylneuraminate synthase